MDNPLLFGLQVSLIGIVVVFTALTLVTFALIGLSRVTPWLVKWGGAEGHGHGHGSTSEAPSLAATSPDAISPEVMAAISAAVVVALGKKARIKRVRYRNAQPSPAWSVQGRATIMASHVVKR